VTKLVNPVPILNTITVSKKYQKNLKLFFAGFCIFTFFDVLAVDVTGPIPVPVSQGIQVISLVLICIGSSNVFKYEFDNSYLKVVFTLFIIYSIFVCFNGLNYDYNSLKIFFLDSSYGLLVYLAPLVLLLKRNMAVYKKLFNVILIFGGIVIFFTVLNFSILRDPDRLNLMSLGWAEGIGILSRPLGLYFITFLYHAKSKDFIELGKKNIFALVVFLISLYFALYRARRGMIFTCTTILISFVGFYFAYAKKKVVPIGGIVIVAASIAIYFSVHGMPSMMQFLAERGDEDTRTGVEEYFYADMSTADMIFGRGINGKYYCPTVENVLDNAGDGMRNNIETGYLNIILKGGLISLVLMAMILVPAVYLGFFKSRNLLAKASAIWILLWILYQYPLIGVAFSLHYITIWICVGICYSAKIRQMSDNSIQAILVT
jgi:hypothetical protein